MIEPDWNYYLHMRPRREVDSDASENAIANAKVGKVVRKNTLVKESGESSHRHREDRSRRPAKPRPALPSHRQFKLYSHLRRLTLRSIDHHQLRRSKRSLNGQKKGLRSRVHQRLSPPGPTTIFQFTLKIFIVHPIVKSLIELSIGQ